MAHWIQVLTGPLEGMTFSVEGGQTISLGRVNGNDVLLAFDPWISSQHGLIKNRDGQIFLMDSGSSNGSFVNAERLRPHHYIPVTGYFVLGATVFKIRRSGQPVVGEPLPVSHPDMTAILDVPLWRLAIDISKERRFPMVHSLHLLMALRRQHRTLMDQILRDMESDLQDLDARLENLDIFNGENAWMNRFIKYQTRVPHQREALVTPLLQRLIRTVGPEAPPATLLERLLSTSFNLLYPALALPSPEALPANGLYSTNDASQAQEIAAAMVAKQTDQKPAKPPQAPQKAATPPHPVPVSKPEPSPPLPPVVGKGTVELDARDFQSDHNFSSRIESVLHGFIKTRMGLNVHYSDGSESVQAHKVLSLQAKQSEMEVQLDALLNSLTTAFEHWFEGFLEQIDPNTLEKVAGEDPAARWKEFRYRFELMDFEFTKTHFMDIAMRLLKKQINLQP